MDGAVQLQEGSEGGQNPDSVGKPGVCTLEHQNGATRSASPLARPSSKSRRSEASVASGGSPAVLRQSTRRRHSGKVSRKGSSRVTLKRDDELLTALAVPKGYLDYWNEKVDEVVADFEDTEEFETTYKNQEQRLFPFRTSSTEWTINGAFGTLVFVMAWGPIVMAMGFVFGGLVGFAFSLANDLCRLRRRQSAAKEQRRKIDNLMRWANYHFATSQSQLQLIFKVILEYQVLARLGGSSKTARSQLKLLFQFLKRDDVGHCLWLYLDYFLSNYKRMARSEISMCFLVCQVCTQCVASLRKTPPPVVERMSVIMADEAVQGIFKTARAASAWKKNPEAEKEENVILCADASKEVQRHVMKGGDLVQALRMEGSVPVAINASDTSQESQSRLQTSEEELSAQEDLSGFEEADVAEILAGDLKPNSKFNVVLPGPSFDGSVGRRSFTMKQTFGAGAAPSKSFRSGMAEGDGAAKSPPQPLERDLRSRRSGRVERKASEGQPRLFKSYEDLVNFDTKLKHQTPIGSYEFKFLEEKQAHDDADSMWELTVDQAAIRVYKYNSPDSPVVLVKAYATLDGIPLNVLCHHIRHIPTRLKWDTTFGDYRVIEQDVDGCEMIYCLMKAPFPVSNRDFLQWRRTEEDEEAKVAKMLMRSADHPSVPEKSGCVRAETLISGYIMEARMGNEKSSDLFILAQTDVKGLIPKWIVNTTAARAPVGWVESLKKACIAYMKQHGDFVPPYNPLA